MVNRISYFLLVLILPLALLAQEEASENLKEIEIVAGLEKIIKLDFVPNTVVKIANENLAQYQIVPSKKELTITGLKPGETTITLRDTAGDIRARYLLKITSSDQSKVVMQLKELLGDVEGLEIGIKGDSVYVGGQIVVPSDIGKVVVILDKYPDVLRLVELSPQTQLVIAKRMQEEIHRGGNKDITVRVVNGVFWVEGVVGTQKADTNVRETVFGLLPDQIQNLARRADAVSKVVKEPWKFLFTVNETKQVDPIDKMFKITAQFVELTKGYDRLFAFSWNPLMGGDGGSIAVGKTSSGGVTTSSNGTLAATISNLFPKLVSAKNAGYARVIQSGVIVVNDRKSGKINKSTSIPYAIGAGDNIRSGSASSGFNLNVKPTYKQANDRVLLEINLTVQAVTGDPPNQLDNSVSTEMYVKPQDSAVIGGVVSSKTQTDFDRDGDKSAAEQGTGQSLFTFVKSKKYSTNRSQFVMFITPEIIESAATGVSEIERKFRKRSR